MAESNVRMMDDRVITDGVPKECESLNDAMRICDVRESVTILELIIMYSLLPCYIISAIIIVLLITT